MGSTRTLVMRLRFTRLRSNEVRGIERDMRRLDRLDDNGREHRIYDSAGGSCSSCTAAPCQRKLPDERRARLLHERAERRAAAERGQQTSTTD